MNTESKTIQKARSSQTVHILTSRSAPRLLSLVIPIYNEEETLPFLRQEIENFIAQCEFEVEICLINDGSYDRSLFFLDTWARDNKQVKLISLSRNFGHQIAVSAGLEFASGDAIVIMDADLQDPLEVIPLMIEKYQQGYEVVYGKRIERAGETPFKKVTAWLFYRLMRTLVHKDLPEDVGDFRLISSDFLQEYLRFKESHRFIRGLIAWCGFPQTAVTYKRAPRMAGTTKYPLSKMLHFAWNASISFSPLPLKVLFYWGIVVAFFGFLVGMYAVIRYFYYHLWEPSPITYNPGWTTIIVLICIIGGSILIGIGILGEYIARIFDEVKARPQYFVSLTRNIPSSPKEASF